MLLSSCKPNCTSNSSYSGELNSSLNVQGAQILGPETVHPPTIQREWRRSCSWQCSWPGWPGKWNTLQVGEILLLCLINCNGHAPEWLREMFLLNYEYNTFEGTWWYIEKVFDHYKVDFPCGMDHLVWVASFLWILCIWRFFDHCCCQDARSWPDINLLHV